MQRSDTAFAIAPNLRDRVMKEFTQLKDIAPTLIRRVNCNPQIILNIAVLLGSVFTVLNMIFLTEIYRDVGSCYAYGVRVFASGNYLEALRVDLPVLQIALGGIVSKLTGLEAFSALVFVTGAFYVLSAWPLFWLLRRFLMPAPAAWGVMLYMLAPKVIRFSTSGLCESGRNFFMILGCFLMFSLTDRIKAWKIVALGFCLAALSLSRSEGILNSGMMILLLFAGFCWQRRRNINWRAVVVAAATSAAVLLVMLSGLAPRVYQVYRITGEPVLDSRMIGMAQTVRRTVLRQSVPTDVPSKYREAMSRMNSLPDIGERILSTVSSFIRGGYELYLVFAIVGLVAAVRRREWRFEYTAFAVLIATNIICFFSIVNSYRYYTFVIPLLMVFTVNGIALVWRMAERFRVGWTLPLLFAGIAVGQIVNGLDNTFKRKHYFEVEAGHWIRAHRSEFAAAPGEKLKIFSQYPEVFFYCDAIQLGNSYESPLPDGFDLAIFEAGSQDEIEVIRSFYPMTEIDHPYRNKVRIFKAERKKSLEK